MSFGCCCGAPLGKPSWVPIGPRPRYQKREKGRESIRGAIGVLLDPPKRKEYEEALREDKGMPRTFFFFRRMREAIFITDGKGRLTDANVSFLGLLGYSKEEAIGMDVIDLYINRGDKEKCVRAMNENGFVKGYGLKLKKKDGEAINCLLTGNARRTHEGGILGYQGIIHSIP